MQQEQNKKAPDKELYVRIPISAISFESCFDEQRWAKMKANSDEKNIESWIFGIEALFLNGRELVIGNLSAKEVGIAMDATEKADYSLPSYG